jgi:uncharacterized membrane protein
MSWRIGYGCVRIFLAIVLLKFIGIDIVDVITTLLSHEIVTDPDDVLFAFLTTFSEHWSLIITYFLPIYLAFWGVTDVFLSIAMLKKMRWAFPVSLGCIGLFVLYEIYRVMHTHSLMLLWIIFVDIVIMYVIHQESLSLGEVE